MGLIAKKPRGSDIELIPEDTYQAVCSIVVDLGTQHIAEFNVDKERVIIGWELPAIQIEIEKDGKKIKMPRVISKEYTLSLHPKSLLRPLLESWRGKSFTKEEEEGFHLKNLLGANCMLQVLHSTSKKTGEPYAYVANVSKLYAGLQKIEAKMEYHYFNFDDDMDVPDTLPEWMVKKIQDSYEYHDKFGQELPGVNAPFLDDSEESGDIPF